MFAISFRIPIDVLGTRQYINGSTLYHERLKPGTIISVVDKSWSSSYNGLDAEVIQSNGSQRTHDSFKWGSCNVSEVPFPHEVQPRLDHH